MGISVVDQHTTPCYRTATGHTTQNEDHQHTRTSTSAAESTACCCRKQNSSKSYSRVRASHTSWLNISFIILALVFPLILESNLSSCNPLRDRANEQQSSQSRYLIPGYRQHQQQLQAQIQQQQQNAPSHHHQYIRPQRHYRPLSDNMEVRLARVSNVLFNNIARSN